MSRLPEYLVTGPHATITDDHGVRVGELTREVAHELGLSERDTIDVVRAAHMHELGRLKLEAGESATQRELAAAGGAAVRMVSGQLERVAQIVEAHGDLTSPAAQREDLRRQVRIVAACCEIDRYAPDPIEPGQLDEVVVRLVRDVGDLEVVSALTRVLNRQLVPTL
jgi:ribulose kinase